MHCCVHAASQQTPSAQNPLAHWDAVVHTCPWTSVQSPPVHVKVALMQSLATTQVVAQVDPLQT